VFTARQALDAGWTARQVQRRRESGAWSRLAGTALWVPTAAPTAPQLAWAAHLTWPEAVIAYATAAGVYQLPVDPALPAEVISHRGLRRAHGLIAHDVPLTRAQWRTAAGGLPITTLPRTVVDCLAAMPFENALDLWAWCSSRRVLSRDQLAAEVQGRLGRHGTRQLLRLLRLTASGAVSGAEVRLHRLLRRAGLTGWEAGVRICSGGRVIAVADVLFREAFLIIEVDGWRAHDSREAFQRDRTRQNRLVMAGYTVLRVTWEDLTVRPEMVLAQIHHALARDRRLRRA
jgi:very-short-patch-repair endonuclease